MSHLAELLREAVDEARFDLERIEFMPSKTVSSAYPEDIVTPSELRDLLAHRPYHDQKVLCARNAKIIIAEGTLSRLTEHLQTVLQDLIDTPNGRIGHVFPIGFPAMHRTIAGKDGIQYYRGQSSVHDFAKGIVRGATILGAEHMLQLIESWMQGEGAVFHTRVLLNGAAILTQGLNPIKGVRIEPLPLSTDQLTGYLPDRAGIEPRDYLGRTVLSIEHKVEPTLYHPLNEQAVKAWWHTELSGVDIPTVCHAFALETDTHADAALRWNDYLALEACALRKDDPTWSYGPSQFRASRYPYYSQGTSYPDNVSTLKVDDRGKISPDEQSVGATISALADKRSKKSRIAAARWASSKNSSSSLEDRFIDLRVALETLYLQDFGDKNRGEMRFRLALTGAWHLGSDVAERRQISKTLREAYAVASGVVHSGQASSTPENHELLRDAQSLCRKGLLKMLREGPPKDWWELILGGEMTGNQA